MKSVYNEESCTKTKWLPICDCSQHVIKITDYIDFHFVSCECGEASCEWFCSFVSNLLRTSILCCSVRFVRIFLKVEGKLWILNLLDTSLLDNHFKFGYLNDFLSIESIEFTIFFNHFIIITNFFLIFQVKIINCVFLLSFQKTSKFMAFMVCDNL